MSNLLIYRYIIFFNLLTRRLICLCTDEKCTYYSFLFTFLVDQILTNIILKIIKCPSVLLPGTPGSNAPCLIWFNSCLTNAPVQSLNIWNNPGRRTWSAYREMPVFYHYYNRTDNVWSERHLLCATEAPVIFEPQYEPCILGGHVTVHPLLYSFEINGITCNLIG